VLPSLEDGVGCSTLSSRAAAVKRIVLEPAIRRIHTVGQSLDIDLLRSFVAIAECGVLGVAAARVGRTQSALSMQMQRLEGIVEQPLLHRTGRGVTLTAAGERLLVRAGELLRKHDETLAELRGDQLSGRLCFGCPDDYAVVFLPHLLRGFASLHPRVQLEVVCAPTPRLRELLARHTVNLALVSVPGDSAGDAVIRREPLVWVAQRGAAALSQDPLPLALGAPDSMDHQLPRRALEAAGRAYRLVYASSSLAGLIAMARSGQAVTVLTRTAVPDDLQVLSPAHGLPELPGVGLTLAFDREAPGAAAAAFAAHIRQVLPEA
jgi:DNA-binding transcriptional LysR family regulator